MDENYLTDLFINEAKPALNRYSGSGGSSGGPVQAGKLTLVDSKTDKRYTVQVTDGNLTMKEANS